MEPVPVCEEDFGNTSECSERNDAVPLEEPPAVLHRRVHASRTVSMPCSPALPAETEDDRKARMRARCEVEKKEKQAEKADNDKRAASTLGPIGRFKLRFSGILGRLMQLRRNGLLLQAIGVPLRHLFAVVGIVMIAQGMVSSTTCWFAFSLWPVSGFGITAGAHRLWTHQSYKPGMLMEAMLIFFYSIADQGPIGGWALTHALHHRASDTEQDPHNRNAGFWYAHFGWLFSSHTFKVHHEDYTRIVGKFTPIVRLHDRCSPWWDPLCSHCMPAFVASFWGEALAGFFVAGALRWMLVQHITFFVNSVAHGEVDEGDPTAFDAGAVGIGPRVSLLVTILALGEGWHDYHHLFPWDYAAAELGAWDQWNPTKVFIDFCSNLGLCAERRTCSDQLQCARRTQLMARASSSPSGTEAAPCKYKVVGRPFLRTRVLAEPMRFVVSGPAVGCTNPQDAASEQDESAKADDFNGEQTQKGLPWKSLAMSI